MDTNFNRKAQAYIASLEISMKLQSCKKIKAYLVLYVFLTIGRGEKKRINLKDPVLTLSKISQND